MQTHLVVPARLAEAVLGKRGAEARRIAATVGCQLQVRAPCDDREADQRVIIVGTSSQCTVVQEVLFGRLAEALRAHGQPLAADRAALLLFIRAEAAGVVVGKQGFVLRQIGQQSGASIELLREEVKRLRPCIITGTWQNVLRAERHVFDLVSAVPVALPAPRRPWRRHEPGRGPKVPLPRTRVSAAPAAGVVVSWRGQFGWVQPCEPIDHHQANAHQGLLYLHCKDFVGGAPVAGQRVRYQVYSDSNGLGAEECFAE
uniref:K Homology domain-containing protein n=1 Tax=Zooxanthella nutricula TaxID=1333877 RepID=A0A7S2QNB2_9DINO|mmetsp:Transcript_97748/g.298673  ORF Transcript_97748/g.298673 Transcript_97748/m.298673 type:complete len:258 (+) Transcript_97748:154-927(+)